MEGVEYICALLSVADPDHLKEHPHELEAACPKELKIPIPNDHFFKDPHSWLIMFIMDPTWNF
ncbi:17935_t:CDS:2 [Entrophospora sp. SA101]|nr:17935_t:CDS:2 [Entrophospora sp. SA101]CAJ0827763.1 14029_t:CDS:2 [Entrophospora sp. SA101]CAJ0851379.1 4894_t:CDS:2 [Entrophospora sp. SA101]